MIRACSHKDHIVISKNVEDRAARIAIVTLTGSDLPDPGEVMHRRNFHRRWGDLDFGFDGVLHREKLRWTSEVEFDIL